MIVNAVELAVAAIRCKPSELTLTWQNESYSVYGAMWLRDNDPANRDKNSGQRLVSLADLPAEPKLRSAEAVPEGCLTLHWEDGVTSVFALRWLRSFDRSQRIKARPARMPWMSQPASAFAGVDFTEWNANEDVREEWLTALGRDGLALLRGVRAFEDVAATMGYIRETSRGRVFDGGNGSDALHTDDPFRDPVPSFELLHCIGAAGAAKKIGFVDGMAVAERLRAREPEAFKLLCQMPAPFRFDDAQVDLKTERSMIELDALEHFRAIHYNEQALAPLTLKGSHLVKYYAAYRRLAELLREASRRVTCELQSGDVVVFDNTRVLHQVSPSHEPSLQGCYVDADGIYNSLAVLARARKARDENRRA